MDTLIIIGLILAFILVILSIIYFCFRKRGRDNSSNKNRFKNTPWAIDNLQKNFHKKEKLDKIHTPIFYINLDRSSDRRAVMEKQLKAVSSNYQRVSAVDGKKMTNKIADQVDDITFQNDYTNLSLTEIGCTLSHIKAIRMAYDKGYNKALIIEDDLLFYLYPFWENSIEDIANKAPYDWGIIQLYAIEEKCNSEEEGFIKYNENNICYGTPVYLINRRGMYNVLNRSSFLDGYNIIINNNIKNSEGQADIYIYDSTDTYIYTKPIFLVGDEFLPSTIHREHEDGHIQSVNRKIDIYKKLYSYEKIPNIIHFVFGLKKQTKEFLFPYYLAVFSAFKVNNPRIIYFYYHYLPFGKWWEELKKIPRLKFVKVEIPKFIGKKPIKKTAHKADIIRMKYLYEIGGIYMDIDTISVRPYKDLLINDVVLGREIPSGICNAVMMSKPESKFFEIWSRNYEDYFETDGWGEASIILPDLLSKKHPELLTILEPEFFFLPTWKETHKIFKDKYNIPKKLITLHLWETYSLKYLKNIKDWNWAKENSHTLYGKIILKLFK